MKPYSRNLYEWNFFSKYRKSFQIKFSSTTHRKHSYIDNGNFQKKQIQTGYSTRKFCQEGAITEPIEINFLSNSRVIQIKIL